MGYDFHITRKTVWFDENGPSIAEAEWTAICTEFPQLEEFAYFYEDRIVAKNADVAQRKVLIQAAQRLAATVQGDDGETYSINADGSLTDDMEAHRIEQSKFKWSELVKAACVLIAAWLALLFALWLFGAFGRR